MTAVNRIGLALAGLALLIAAPLSAEDAAYDLDIESQPLAAALKEFAEQSGLQVVYYSELANGERSPEVSGAMTADQAMAQLLASTDLTFDTMGDDTVVVEAAAAQVESEVTSELGNLRPTPSAMLMAQAVANRNEPRSEASHSQQAESLPVDEQVERLEEIIVTGTNIRGVVNPTTPVLQFDRRDIELSGAATVEDFLRTLPQNFGSETQLTADSGNPNTSGRNGFLGNVIDLRGLGAGSTLTLLNGRRMAAVGSTNFVDVSILPLGAIDRIDVLTDGASAVYGSDAIGGVVNFITRKDYEGFEVSARYGTVTDGAKEDFGIGAAGGLNWGSGGGVMGVDFLERTPLLISDRDFIDRSDLRNPESNFGSEDERLSIAASAYQQFGERVTTSIDVLYSDRSSESQDIDSGAIVRSDQEALFVNGQVAFELSVGHSLEFFVDHGQNTNEGGESVDDFAPRNFENRLRVAEGRLSGQLLTLPGGNASYSLGGAYREEEFTSGIFGFDADRSVEAFYAETLVPIIGSRNALPLVDRLEVSAAVRYEQYSDVGDSTDPRIGLFWGVNDELSFRAAYSESFRAPDLNTLNRQERYFAFGAPLSLATAFDPPEPDDRLSLPNAFVLLTPTGGNASLVPEAAETWSAGIDYSPRFLDGFELRLNYFDIAYTNRIDSLSFLELLQVPAFRSLVDFPPDQTELEAIFRRVDAGSAELLDFTFLSSGPVRPEDVQVFVNSGMQNVAERDVNGIDVNLEYTRSTDIGQFAANVNASYLLDFSSRIAPTADSANQIDTLYNPLDFVLRSGVSWSRDGLTAFLALNYRDGYQDEIQDEFADDIDSWTTWDLSLFYATDGAFEGRLLSDVRVGVSVTNMFDEDPPFVETFDSLNFDTANADPFGRQVTISLNKRF